MNTTHAGLDPAVILAHLGVAGVADIAAITEGGTRRCGA